MSKRNHVRYDIFNRRIVKSIDADGAGPNPAEQEIFIHDGLRSERGGAGDHILLRFDGSGDLTDRYLHGAAVDQILAEEAVANPAAPGDVLWALTDHLGTVRDLVKYDTVNDESTVANHIVYDAFGRIVAETDPAAASLFGFTGRERDAESDLQYNRARYYDAALGRWLSEDPIGFAAGDANLNRYVGNGVVGESDPSGLVRGGFPFGPLPPPPQSPHSHLNGNNCYTGFTANNEPVPDLFRPSRPTTRPLTSGEIEMLEGVFGDAIDYEGLVVGTVPLHPWHGGNSITPFRIPWMAPENYAEDYSVLRHNDWRRGHFIHEFMHVLQHQRGNCNPLNAFAIFVTHGFDYDATYNVDTSLLGNPLWTFNMEQQAVIIQNVYNGVHTGIELQLALKTINGFNILPPPASRPIPYWYNK